MFCFGKLKPTAAVAFIAAHPEATLGSMSKDGMRRVNCPESLIDAFVAAGGSVAPIKTANRADECVPCQKPKLGDAIKDRLVKETGDKTVCGDCHAEIDRLNTMTRDEVLQEAPALADRITGRAKTQAASIIHRTAARVAPSLVSQEIQGWIEGAVVDASELTDR